MNMAVDLTTYYLHTFDVTMSQYIIVNRIQYIINFFFLLFLCLDGAPLQIKEPIYCGV